MQNITNTLATAPTMHRHAGEYDSFIDRMNARFAAITGPLFHTDAAGLYAAYLASFEAGADRQYHTCNCCEQFIERFGGLAYVDDAGLLVSAMWLVSEAPAHYMPAVAAMEQLVRRAAITMPFLSSESIYGTPASTAKTTGTVWHHFAIAPPVTRVYKGSVLKNAHQAASEKREEYGSVLQAMGEYSRETVATALTLLKNDTLGNSAAVLGQAQFLVDVHAEMGRVSGIKQASNLVFRAVATAPAGFCHPRSGIIATLLDDIAAGKSFEQAQAAWNAKMHPLAYQRPQAAPTAGAIAAAEAAFEKLGAASALKRRYATLADILETVWKPKAAPAPAAGGIFGSIKPKGAAAPAMSMRAPAIAITWDKFQRTVLPTADTIEIYTPGGQLTFAVLTTAVEPDALPILQWDRAEQRNPVALYLWNGGSPASQFGLTAGRFHKVTAITLRPSMWFGGGFDHQSVGALFVIDGARETRTGAGNALFPSTLKSEFHGMRSVIESYSKGQELEGREQGDACGILIGKESSAALVRVTSAGLVTEFKIDRWD